MQWYSCALTTTQTNTPPGFTVPSLLFCDSCLYMHSWMSEITSPWHSTCYCCIVCAPRWLSLFFTNCSWRSCMGTCAFPDCSTFINYAKVYTCYVIDRDNHYYYCRNIWWVAELVIPQGLIPIGGFWASELHCQNFHFFLMLNLWVQNFCDFHFQHWKSSIHDFS